MKIFKHAFYFITRDVPIHIIMLITVLLPNHLITNRIRGFFVSLFLGKKCKRLQVGRGVIINNPQQLFLGDNCYLSHNSYIQAKGNVFFEDNVIVGPMSVIASSNHIISDGVVMNKGISKPIHIGKGTWLGSHVSVMSGVTIGSSVIVGAGAVVTKDIPNNTIARGVPAVAKIRAD